MACTLSANQKTESSLESDTHYVVVSRDYKGTPRIPWLLSAFEKKENENSVLDNTMDTGETLLGERNDTATPQNTVSENKDSNNSENASVPEQGTLEFNDNPEVAAAEAAEAAGYDANTDYQGSRAFNGAAPVRSGYFNTREERKAAFEDGSFEDTYSLGDYMDAGLDNNDLEWQLANPIPASARDKATLESINNLNDVVKDKKQTIKMYRAVPADVKEDSFRNGDWITPSSMYAEQPQAA